MSDRNYFSIPIFDRKEVCNEISLIIIKIVSIFFLFLLLSSILCTISYAGNNNSAIIQNDQYSGTESLLTTSSSGTDQELPAIWEDRIIWKSQYSNPNDSGSILSELFLYNLSTGKTTRVASGLTGVTMIDIWEDLVVWNSCEGDYSDIYLFNLSNSEIKRITNDSLNQVKPQVWESNIVWQDGDDNDAEWNIYLYNIESGNILNLGNGSGFAKYPAIWEDRVVWQDLRNGADYDIFLYNITTGIETRITTDPSDQVTPSIWGDLIVWQDYRNATLQIYVYDLNSASETQVSFGDHNFENPIIHNNSIVFVNQSEYFDIYLIDLLTEKQGKISSDVTGAAQVDPDIWGDRIVWTDSRNGYYDVYLYTLGISKPPLSADFNQNMTQGEPPLSVEFTDISTGEVDGWDWDFGDNSGSAEKNPVHTFSHAGSYSVTLTVYNPMQRDAVTKGDLISVGSPSAPEFSATLTSGLAPLNVSFTDTSSGNPTQWYWEFGDGTSSNEQNPTHIYDVYGTYDVHLTTTNIFGNASIVKQDFILVMNGTFAQCQVPSQGITVAESGDESLISINVTAAPNCSYLLNENNTLLVCLPNQGYGIQQLTLFSTNGFSMVGNDTISGNLSQIQLTSGTIPFQNFSQKIGNNCSVNFSLFMPEYPIEGVIELVAWEGCTQDDFELFDSIKTLYHYVLIDDLAYTVRFHQVNITEISPATLIFAVSSDWVQEYGWSDDRDLEIATNVSGAMVFVDGNYMGVSPIVITNLTPGEHQLRTSKAGYRDNLSTLIIGSDKRESIHVIRIGDNGSGEVLNTTFIGHDDEQNLDFFMAESPNGLSTFGLASLSRSGNLFRLFTLAVTQYVQGSGGGGGGGSGGYVGGLATTPTMIPTQTPAPKLTPRDTIEPSPTGTGLIVTGTTVPTTRPTSQPTDTSGEGWEWPPYLVILRNLSVVFAVIFVAVVFYLRWNKREA